MKKSMLTTAGILCFIFSLFAQEPTISTTVDLDSVLLGNHLTLSITVENAANAQVDPPVFEGFRLLGGPNYASSMSMINGAVTQSVTYSYLLEPKDVGQFYINSVQIKVGDSVLESDPIEINVYHNPDGIIQQPQKQNRMDRWLPWSSPMPSPTPQKPKKKRKRYRL